MAAPLGVSQVDGLRRCRVCIEGVVQGVGFRPFVYRLALRHGLAGSVRNDSHGVTVEAEGGEPAISAFLDALRATAPPGARPGRLSVTWETPRGVTTPFTIAPSRHDGSGALFPAPDTATCDRCLAELADPGDRRHRYPFLNCTACGPRFTIIRDLPYDRIRTVMAAFTLCEACRREYDDPRDRRFHAEATACPSCGPRLQLRDGGGAPLPTVGATHDAANGSVAGDAIAIVAAALASGGIVAVKGLGGYHLAGDATNLDAVRALRQRKRRDAKPFAVMVRDVDAARRLGRVGTEEAALLTSPARPIVLLARREGAGVADGVAPGLHELGVMLPYTPLHHLLLDAVGGPLVMTSGNATDAPIVCDDADALVELRGIADLFLGHDRPIHVRCDDSVARVVRGAPVLLRRARGYVPLPLRLPAPAARPILACGGELKSVFALVRGSDVFLSQHLGDLGDERAYRTYVETVAHFRGFLDISPAVVAHDLHPAYRSTAYARSLAGVERLGVQHHHAHVASCLVDAGVDARVIGVAWDGTGFGTDGHIWGGEFLLADLGGFERAGHLEYVPLPGGEQAVREPWRMAAVFLQAVYGETMDALDLDFTRRLDRAAWRVLARATATGLNAPLTSSAGRLFDAVASLVGGRDRVAHEAQAAMELEALCESEADGIYPVGIAEVDGRLVVQTRDVVRGVVADLLAGTPAARIAARFHATLADVITQVCQRLRERSALGRVALSGGVFQNARLLRATVDGLESSGFEVYTHRHVPPNDGGLALGQAAVAARRLERGEPG